MTARNCPSCGAHSACQNPWNYTLIVPRKLTEEDIATLEREWKALRMVAGDLPIVSKGIEFHRAKLTGLKNPTSGILHSGTWFDYANPDPDTINLSDIAFGLARERRFSGQGISVAEHTIMGFRFLEKMLQDTTARYFAFHDASEAYLRDLPGPLKRLLPGYRYVEQRLKFLIWEKYVGPRPDPEILKLLADVDRDLLLAEGRKFTKWRPIDKPVWSWDFMDLSTNDAEHQVLEILIRAWAFMEEKST